MPSNLQALQYPEEISQYLELVAAAKAKTAIEIGAASCGTSVLLAAAMGEGSLVVSVDLPVDQDGTPVEFEKDATLQAEEHLAKFVLVRGRSDDLATVGRVADALEGRPADILFIDAEHTAQAARADLANYAHLRSTKCLTTFHDICLPELWPMWNRLRGLVPPNRSVEIIKDVSQRDCGIGVILGAG